MSIHEDGDASVEDGGDPEEVAVAGVGFAGFDALEGAAAQAGSRGEGLLGVVGGGPQVRDAFAQLATPFDDPVRVIARHSTKVEPACS